LYDKPYLGDLFTVSAMIEDFVRRVLQVLDSFHAEEMPREASIALISAMCQDLGRIFLGKDDRYQIAPWHGLRLSGKIRALVPGVSGDAQAVVSGYFEWIAKQIIQVSNEMNNGMADAQAGPAIHYGMKDAVQFLLGPK